MRQWIFAAVLAVAAASVTIGAASYSDGAGWVAFGFLLAGWSWLVFGEVGE
jgi:hypothetical protein